MPRAPRSAPTSAPAAAPASPYRGRFTARNKLIAAAYAVMSERGFEGSSIAEIIQAAGVGVGSFYNNFDSKEALAQAVFAARSDDLAAQLEQLIRAADDMAIATAYCYRSLIEAARDPVWAAFIARLEPSMQALHNRLREYARPGFEAAVASGRFKMDDIEEGMMLLHGMVISVIGAYRRGEISLEAAHATAKYPLRMFGVPQVEADDLSTWSLERLRQVLDANLAARQKS